jgi:hypothetical protein
MFRKVEPDFKALSDEKLVEVRIAIEAEMRKRHIEFSVGLMGEKLVIDHFNNTPGLPGLLRAERGTKNVDANSRTGHRYTIKTLLNAQKTGAIYDEHRDVKKPLFEYLLLVRLDEQYRLKSIHRLTWEQFVKVRKWDKRMTAWYLTPSAATLAEAETILG